MSDKFHIANGLVKPCKAHKRQCKYGEHFESSEKAQSYIDNKKNVR